MVRYMAREDSYFEILHSAALRALEAAIAQSTKYPSSYSVLLQRPSRTGAERFKTNELHEKPEQEASLRQLMRTGGQNLYMSPSLDWVAECTDIIEAVPLFIY